MIGRYKLIKARRGLQVTRAAALGDSPCSNYRLPLMAVAPIIPLLGTSCSRPAAGCRPPLGRSYRYRCGSCCCCRCCCRCGCCCCCPCSCSSSLLLPPPPLLLIRILILLAPAPAAAAHAHAHAHPCPRLILVLLALPPQDGEIERALAAGGGDVATAVVRDQRDDHPRPSTYMPSLELWGRLLMLIWWGSAGRDAERHHPAAGGVMACSCNPDGESLLQLHSLWRIPTAAVR